MIYKVWLTPFLHSSKPEILNEVAALEIFSDGKVYYKIRSVDFMKSCQCMSQNMWLGVDILDQEFATNLYATKQQKLLTKTTVHDLFVKTTNPV